MDSTGHLLSPEALVTDWEQLSANITNAIEQVNALAASAKSITFNVTGNDLLGLIERIKNVESILEKTATAADGVTTSVNEMAKATQSAAIQEQKSAIINLNNINKRKAAESDLLQAQIAYGEKYIELLNSESNAEQAAAIKNKNTIDARKAREADLLRSQQAFGESYIAMLEKQNIAEQRRAQKVVDANSAIYNSISGLKGQMVELQLSGQGLSDEYLILAERANALAVANEKVNNAIANPSGLAAFRTQQQNTPAVVSSEEIQEAQTYEQRLAALQIEINDVAEAKVKLALATKEETAANEQNIISQKENGEVVDLTTVKVKNLEDQILALNTLIKGGGRPENIAMLNAQLDKTKAQLAILKPEAQAAAGSIGSISSNAAKASGSMNVLGMEIENGTNLFKIFDKAKNMAFRFPALLAEIAVMTILFEIITKITEQFTKLSDAEQIAKDNLKEFADAKKDLQKDLNNLSAESGTNYDKEYAKVETLAKILTSHTAVLDAKKDAYQQLDGIMHQVMKNYTLEQAMSGEATTAIQKQVEAYSDLKGQIDALQPIFEKQSAAFQKDYERRETARKYGGQPNQLIDARIAKELDAVTNTKNKIEDLQNQLLNITANPTEKKGRKLRTPREGTYTGDIDIEIEKLKEQAEVKKAIWQDEKGDLEERFRANSAFQILLVKISSLEADKRDRGTYAKIGTAQQSKKDIPTIANISEQNKAIENGEKELIASQEKYNTESVKLAQEGAKNVGVIFKTNQDYALSKQKAALEKQLNQIELGYLSQEETLKKSLDKKEITTEQYNKRLTKLQKTADAEITDAQIKAYGDMLLSADLYLKNEEEIEAKIVALRKHRLHLGNEQEKEQPSGALSDLEAGITTLKRDDDEFQGGALQKQLTSVKDFTTQALDIYTQFYDAQKQMRDNAFAAEQQQLEIRMREVQLASKQQIDAINASVGYQIDKENQASKVVAQTTAEENQIQQEQNAVALKKAKADKQAAESGIEMNTALAISKILPLFATNPVLAATEIALVTAIGVAQYQAAASTPLPQFWTGGTTSTNAFSAGERGFELIAPPDKPAYFSTNTASVYNEPIGTKITAHGQTKALIEQAMTNVYSVNAPKRSEANFSKEVAKELALLIGDRFEDVGNGIQQAVYKSRAIVNVNARSGGDRLSYKIGRNR